MIETKEGDTYTISREYLIEKINEKEFKCPNSTELWIEKKKHITNDTTEILGKEAAERIDHLFPINFSTNPPSFFDSLIFFSNFFIIIT